MVWGLPRCVWARESTAPAQGNLLLLSHFSRVRLCAAPQTAAHQAPQSLGFSTKRAPRAAFPSDCLAAQTKRWAEGIRASAPRPLSPASQASLARCSAKMRRLPRSPPTPVRSSRPAAAMSFFPELYFNVDNGYLEGLVRGLKAGVLSQADYLNLVQCETLEGEPRGRGAGPRKPGKEIEPGLKVLRSGRGIWGCSKGLRGRGAGSGPERPAGSLAVQWLRLHTPNAGGPVLILGQGTRSHMPQLSPSTAK